MKTIRTVLISTALCIGFVPSALPKTAKITILRNDPDKFKKPWSYQIRTQKKAGKEKIVEGAKYGVVEGELLGAKKALEQKKLGTPEEGYQLKTEQVDVKTGPLKQFKDKTTISIDPDAYNVTLWVYPKSYADPLSKLQLPLIENAVNKYRGKVIAFDSNKKPYLRDESEVQDFLKAKTRKIKVRKLGAHTAKWTVSAQESGNPNAISYGSVTIKKDTGIGGVGGGLKIPTSGSFSIIVSGTGLARPVNSGIPEASDLKEIVLTDEGVVDLLESQKTPGA